MLNRSRYASLNLLSEYRSANLAARKSHNYLGQSYPRMYAVVS